MKRIFCALLAGALTLGAALPVQAADKAVLRVAADAKQTAISDHLYGAFIEDISYACDGGLVSNLVNNDSFEYASAPTTGWVADGLELTTEGNLPLNKNNPTYAKVTVDGKGSLTNLGFTEIYKYKTDKYDKKKANTADMGFVADQVYDFSCYVRSGGFTGKGMFASMAYLVVEYDGGKQKQCNFKDERDVDKLLEVLAKEQPQIHLLSAAGEQMLQKKEAEKASRKLPESELTDDARHSITVLRRAKEYLEAKPEIADELSAAERRKRAQLQSKPVYRYVALAIFVMGIVSAAYGLYAVTTHTGGYGIYFALFGFAAIFLFSSYNMLPTAHNNHSAIMKRAEKAEAAMAEYVKHYPNGAFPVPSHYAHPIVLKQMADAIEEGRAVTVPEALTAVENRLKSLNADVQVEQEEYDEVVVIKAMFLNHDYQ